MASQARTVVSPSRQEGSATNEAPAPAGTAARAAAFTAFLSRSSCGISARTIRASRGMRRPASVGRSTFRRPAMLRSSRIPFQTNATASFASSRRSAADGVGMRMGVSGATLRDGNAGGSQSDPRRQLRRIRRADRRRGAGPRRGPAGSAGPRPCVPGTARGRPRRSKTATGPEAPSPRPGTPSGRRHRPRGPCPAGRGSRSPGQPRRASSQCQRSAYVPRATVNGCEIPASARNPINARSTDLSPSSAS